MRKEDVQLLNASQEGDTAEVKAALERGADVNARTDDGETALEFAASLGYTDIVHALLKSGADVNARDYHSNHTPLMLAAAKGHTEIVRVLLEKRADVNAKSNFGKTALMHAEFGGHPGIVELLKEAGAVESVTDQSEGKADVNGQRDLYIIKWILPTPPPMVNLITGGWLPVAAHVSGGTGVCVFTNRSRAENYLPYERNDLERRVEPYQGPIRLEIEKIKVPALRQLTRLLEHLYVCVDPTRTPDQVFIDNYYPAQDFSF